MPSSRYNQETVKIIFFSGLDGSGKSTHSRLLASYMKNKGFDVRLVWMRWFALFSYPLLALCKFIGLTKRLHNSSIPLREYWRYKSIAWLWLNLYLLDYLIYMLSKLCFHQGIIIADRFAVDALVDVIFDTRLNPVRHLIGRFFLTWIYRLLRKGAIRGVVMSVDACTVFKRRNDIPSAEYVVFRIPIYSALARYLDIPVIDGRREIISNFKKILEILKFKYG